MTKNTKKDGALKPHRGRFQAQGHGLEESEAWAQEAPLTIEQALDLINRLEGKLQPSDRRKRESLFSKLRDKVNEINRMGGYDADKGGQLIKSEPPWASPSEPRVDVEVRKGRAFVDKEEKK